MSKFLQWRSKSGRSIRINGKHHIIAITNITLGARRILPDQGRGCQPWHVAYHEPHHLRDTVLVLVRRRDRQHSIFSRDVRDLWHWDEDLLADAQLRVRVDGAEGAERQRTHVGALEGAAAFGHPLCESIEGAERAGAASCVVRGVPGERRGQDHDAVICWQQRRAVALSEAGRVEWRQEGGEERD